ncbi:protein Aatf-like [Ornithodoros turicata]|uniref:protein Aatf-like n=1 Tax=Ornithodoros turicata TaxID=34597 RepID=UPI0031386C29
MKGDSEGQEADPMGGPQLVKQRGNSGGKDECSNVRVVVGLKRRCTLDAVTKTVKERKQKVKTVTNRNTGVSERDAHVKSNTDIEEENKRGEEVVKSYKTIEVPTSPRRRSSASSPRTKEKPPQPPLSSSETSPDDMNTQQSKKSTPVTIRVEDRMIHYECESESSEEAGDIKASDRNEDHDTEEALRNEFGSPTSEDDDAFIPPSQLNYRRKDSIAVTKHRLLKEQEEGPHDEDDDDDDAQDDEADDGAKHPVFMRTLVSDIISPDLDYEKDHNDEVGVKEALAARAEATKTSPAESTSAVPADEAHGSRSAVQELQCDAARQSEGLLVPDVLHKGERSITLLRPSASEPFQPNQEDSTGSVKQVSLEEPGKSGRRPLEQPTHDVLKETQKAEGAPKSSSEYEATAQSERVITSAATQDQEGVQEESSSVEKLRKASTDSLSFSTHRYSNRSSSEGSIQASLSMNEVEPQRLITRIETMTVTNEVKDAFRYPTHRLVRKQVSETTIEIRKRTYTEFYIEPNPPMYASTDEIDVPTKAGSRAQLCGQSSRETCSEMEPDNVQHTNERSEH